MGLFVVGREHVVSMAEVWANAALFAFHFLLELFVYLFGIDVAFSSVVVDHSFDEFVLFFSQCLWLHYN